MKIEASAHRQRLKEAKPTIPNEHKGLEIVYHVFTDNKDVWVNSLRRANRIFRRFGRRNGSARLYEERYTDKEYVETDSEDCRRSIGGFPL